MKNNRERSRVNYRYVKDRLKVYYRLAGGLEWSSCRLEDISYEGAGLRLLQILDKDDKLEIMLSGKEGRMVAKCDVVHFSGVVTGVKFKELTVKDKAFLDKLFYEFSIDVLKMVSLERARQIG